MFHVRLHDRKGNALGDISLPFSPFPGLLMMAPQGSSGIIIFEYLLWEAEEYLFEAIVSTVERLK